MNYARLTTTLSDNSTTYPAGTPVRVLSAHRDTYRIKLPDGHIADGVRADVLDESTEGAWVEASGEKGGYAHATLPMAVIPTDAGVILVTGNAPEDVTWELGTVEINGIEYAVGGAVVATQSGVNLTVDVERVGSDKRVTEAARRDIDAIIAPLQVWADTVGGGFLAFVEDTLGG